MNQGFLHLVHAVDELLVGHSLERDGGDYAWLKVLRLEVRCSQANLSSLFEGLLDDLFPVLRVLVDPSLEDSRVHRCLRRHPGERTDVSRLDLDGDQATVLVNGKRIGLHTKRSGWLPEPEVRLGERLRQRIAALLGTALHDGWLAYLQGINFGDPHLCHVLAKFGEPLRLETEAWIDDDTEDALAGTLSEADASDAPVSGQAGFPWITPILGSGCLSELDADQLRNLESTPALLAAALRESELPGGIDARGLTASFSQSLLEQRVQELHGATFARAVAPEVNPSEEHQIVAECLLAAAMVRRAWHEAVVIGNELVRPRDVMILPVDDPRSAEVKVSLLRPALDRLDFVQAKIQTEHLSRFHGMRQVLAQLVDRLKNQVNDHFPRLTGHDVDGLVEVAWLMMITPHGLYPGWRDLLTSASFGASLQLQEGVAGHALDFGRPRPAMRNARDAATLAASVSALKSASFQSWNDRLSEKKVGGEVPPRLAFYDSVAELLISQLSYGSLGEPVPTAFVTSMDIELEMSLVRKSQKFTILMPYHFSYGRRSGAQRAMLFWVAATVDPQQGHEGDELDLSKLVVSWRDAGDSVTRSTDTIAVVRLVGSPLLPKADKATPLYTADPFTGEIKKDRRFSLLQRLKARAASAARPDDEKARGFDREYPKQSIFPAVMLDEYSALHQMSAAVQGSLPSNLTRLDPDWYYRFWLAVGVPFDDVLVRLLVASHIDTSSGRRSAIEHHGVMVNRKVPKAEADLLAWQGFDAVNSRLTSVVDELLHYADHMRSANPETSFEADDDCEVPRRAGGRAPW